MPNIRHLHLHLRSCSMTSWFHLVDFQCCGKGLRTDNDGKTISSLRLYNAICVNNIDFGSTTKHLKPRSRVIILSERKLHPHPHLSSSLSKFSNFYVQMFFGQTIPKKVWQSVEVLAWVTCRCWCGGAEVPNADPEAISPLCVAEGQRHESIDSDYYHFI